VRVAYIVRSWPRLSQTFIVNEVLALERLGLELVIFRMTAADEPEAQSHAAEVRSPVHDLETALHRDRAAIVAEHLGVLVRSPWRYLSTVAFVVRGRQLAAGYSTTTRATCFRHAVHVAALVRAERTRGRPFPRLRWPRWPAPPAPSSPAARPTPSISGTRSTAHACTWCTMASTSSGSTLAPVPSGRRCPSSCPSVDSWRRRASSSSWRPARSFHPKATASSA
jgi:hypothetical protein